LLVLAAAVAAMTLPALAQQWPGRPPVPADLQAAMGKADAGDPAALLALADGGRADAQFYAGMMLLSGRGGIKPDGARGCAYEQKAAATRADAQYMVGQCYERGLGGQRDPEKARAAYAAAAAGGVVQAKCEQGQMLLSQGQAEQGLALCRDAAQAGDVDAQMALAQLYYRGGPVKADPGQARKWYGMAAQQGNPQAQRILGEMYANGQGGKKDTKKAIELWKQAETAGDPLTPILMADQLFSELTGGRKPGPGKYAFKGGIPVSDIDAIESWYQEAQKVDPRPEVKARAKQAISVLESFKTAAKSVSVQQK
jgi:TPR repeat protein